MTKFSADWSRRSFLRGALVTGALVLPASGALVGATSGDRQEATEVDKTANLLGMPTDKPIEIGILGAGFGSIWVASSLMPDHTPAKRNPYMALMR